MMNTSKPSLYRGPNLDEARYVAQTVSEMDFLPVAQMETALDYPLD